MTGSYDPLLVAISVLIAVFASYTTLDLANSVTVARGRVRLAWLAAGALAMGVGIWSMHFVGMLAYTLPGVPIAYDVGLVVLSVAVAVLASGLALVVVSRPSVTARGLAVAALAMGGAIAGMHYIGMWSMRMPAMIVWRPGLVAASIAIAVVASFAALWLAFRYRSDRSGRARWIRIGGGVVMGCAVAGMHYAAMAAARMVERGASLSIGGQDVLATEGLAMAVTGTTTLVLVIAVAGSAVARELARRARVAEESALLYREAEDARKEAEALAEELQIQATHLEEQAAELEVANDDLTAAEARLRGIIDSALDAMVITDSDSVIREWSRHAETTFGWSAEEVLGRSLVETIIPPRYRDAHQRGMERYLATGEERILRRRIEIAALHRDGREFPVELTVVATPSGNRLFFTAFVRDITARKLAERRLAAEHAVTRVLADSHTFEEAAPRVLQAIGEALEWPAGSLWVVDESGKWLRFGAFWRCPAASAAPPMAHPGLRFARGEGLPGRVWARGEPVWIEDLTRDPRFPRAGLAAAAGVHGAFAFPVRLGGELLGVMEFFHQEALAPDAALLATVAAIGEDIGQSVRRFRAEQDRDRALDAMKHANAQLQQRTVEAEAASRAKSEFLANMSHELRTPINAVMGYTELLQMGLAGPVTDAQAAQLDRIRASSQHLLGLVDDVLDLSKVEAGQMAVSREWIRAHEPVEGALELVRPQAAEAGLALVDRCGESGEERVCGDGDRIRQILVNLLSNAVKFTGAGGTVTVSCGRTSKPPAEARLTGQGPWACLQVEDTGIGIPAERLEAVFQPFVQADSSLTRARGGTGLGLSLSRRLARLMDGDLTARSTPGEGSCFTLWLPAVPQPADAAVERAELPSTVNAPAGLAELGAVLLAESDTLLRRLVTRIRSDPLIAGAASLSEAELEDHTAVFISALAQSLTLLAETGGQAELMRDGSAIQTLISERHGAQRARFGWTEEELRREFELLREVAAAAPAPRGPGHESALGVLEQLIRRAEEASIRGMRLARAARPAP